ncbi:MAG: 50S ribosomal protein L20 [Bacteriovoracales bacterium]|nr:50S ribosomal protein L20 [Bacteriovoracales bacterium]
MARVRRGFKARRRRKKILKLAKGFHFDRNRPYKRAAEAVKRALHNMYKSRRILKRDMRRLWITRISAASKQLGTSYSSLMAALKKKDVRLNRKMLAEIAARDFESFKGIWDFTRS